MEAYLEYFSPTGVLFGFGARSDSGRRHSLVQKPLSRLQNRKRAKLQVVTF
jgi:hypothetical protein